MPELLTVGSVLISDDRPGIVTGIVTVGEAQGGVESFLSLLSSLAWTNKKLKNLVLEEMNIYLFIGLCNEAL